MPTETSVPGAGSDSSSESAKSFRILCIEDNDSDFVLVREHLRDAGFEKKPKLIRASTLREGLSALAETKPGGGGIDIILLDLSLPDSTGPRNLERVAKVAPNVPVIILSGNEDRDLAVTMVQQGAQDYLSKNGLGGELLLRSILYAQERQRSRLEMRTLNEQLRLAGHELKTAQMQLIQAEKLDSLGRLAAGVAHEVKNPLATLQMGVDFFRRKEEEIGESGMVMVRHMQEAISSADTIIRGMVDYSRSDALELDVCNINGVVRKALRMVQHEALKRNVKVLRDLAVPMPTVKIDQGKIEQVLINILINAIQSMDGLEGDRLLEVRTFWGQVEAIERDRGLRDYPRLRVQDHAVVVEVQDRGGGVPEGKLNRIFEPFFTTKATGVGTGLGLSVAKNIVDLHRGYIGIQNVEEPRGLRVRIFLKVFELPDEVGEFTRVHSLPAAVTRKQGAKR